MLADDVFCFGAFVACWLSVACCSLMLFGGRRVLHIVCNCCVMSLSVMRCLLRVGCCCSALFANCCLLSVVCDLLISAVLG